jgi:hypothetical protein
LTHEADVSPAEIYFTMLEDEKIMTHIEYDNNLAINEPKVL